MARGLKVVNLDISSAVGRRVPRRSGGSLVTSMERICERKRGEPWWNTCTGSTFLPEKLGRGPKEMLFCGICCGVGDGLFEAVGPSWMKGLMSGRPFVTPTGCG